MIVHSEAEIAAWAWGVAADCTDRSVRARELLAEMLCLKNGRDDVNWDGVADLILAQNIAEY